MVVALQLAALRLFTRILAVPVTRLVLYLVEGKVRVPVAVLPLVDQVTVVLPLVQPEKLLPLLQPAPDEPQRRIGFQSKGKA